MKIAMIIDAWNPIVGGGQVHVSNICRQLIHNYDCEIDLYVRSLQDDAGNIYNQDECFFDGKLKIYRCGKARNFFYFPERISSIFSIFFRVYKNNKIIKYDAIHAHSFLGLLSGKISSMFLGIPIIATIHGANFLDMRKRGFYYYIEKYLITFIKYNTVISVGKSFLLYSNRNRNIVVIPNGVNLSNFQEISYIKEQNYFKILFVGRYEWTKGIDVLVEAINLFEREFLKKNSIQVHLVGYGYDEQKYKKLVQKYKLEKYIIFRGKITGEELIQEYASSHLFILPSRTEGFGMTLIEAMAAKTLVLATRCGGPEDIIDDGVDGFLVEKENPLALKNKIEEILFLDKDKMDPLIENAYQKVLEEYTWEKVGESIFDEYQKLF